MKPVFIISGDKGSGKSTFLATVLSLLQMNGFVVHGFVALHHLESDTYRIKNVTTHEEFPVMQRVAGFEKRPDHFSFFPEGVEKGLIWMEEMLEQSPDIAVIDEIGGYELQGKLWSNGFTELVDSEIPLIFTVKTKHLHQVIEKWHNDTAFIFEPADFGDPEKVFEKIKELIRYVG